MTDTPKPFTADEIGATKQVATWSAEMWPFAPPEIHQTIPRLIATIEQQAEQIEKLRGSLSAIRQRANERHGGDFAAERDTVYAMHSIAVEALSATEPVNDKR